MKRLRWAAVAAWLVAGAAVAGGKVYPHRWVYVSRGLHHDQDVEDIRGIVRTAAAHGLNGMVLAAGLDRLDLQPDHYVRRLHSASCINKNKLCSFRQLSFACGRAFFSGSGSAERRDSSSHKDTDNEGSSGISHGVALE